MSGRLVPLPLLLWLVSFLGEDEPSGVTSADVGDSIDMVNKSDHSGGNWLDKRSNSDEMLDGGSGRSDLDAGRGGGGGGGDAADGEEGGWGRDGRWGGWIDGVGDGGDDLTVKRGCRSSAVCAQNGFNMTMEGSSSSSPRFISIERPPSISSSCGRDVVGSSSCVCSADFGIGGAGRRRRKGNGGGAAGVLPLSISTRSWSWSSKIWLTKRRMSLSYRQLWRRWCMAGKSLEPDGSSPL